MGTSSMYSGYSNSGGTTNSLLPTGFDDSENDKQEQNDNPQETENKKDVEIVGTWQNAKTLFSKLYSGKSNNINGALSKYVKAYGGAKTASKSARSGIRTAFNLGGFVSNTSNTGFKETLQSIKIDYENKSLAEIFNDLINLLSPDPITKEDSIARKAMITTFEELYDELEKAGFDIEENENIPTDYLEYLLPKYIENYIYERIINDLGSRIECANITSVEAIQKEEELKNCINAMVSPVFVGRDFLQQPISKEETESLYNQCYTQMEEIL